MAYKAIHLFNYLFSGVRCSVGDFEHINSDVSDRALRGRNMKKTIFIRDLIIPYLLPTDETVRFIDGHNQQTIYEVEDVDQTPVELWRKKVVYIDHGLTDDGMVCVDIYYM